MRIIAGEFGGRLIKNPGDLKTRPTSDRLRETLFNILAPRIDGSTRFLDLCAGSGSIGIEAISRGVKFVTFVDKSRRACGLIEENLDLLNVSEERTEVFGRDAEKFLKAATKRWDMIYFDPPYNSEYRRVLSEVGSLQQEVLESSGILIVEHHSKNTMPDSIGRIRRWRLLKQGESHLSFYELD